MKHDIYIAVDPTAVVVDHAAHAGWASIAEVGTTLYERLCLLNIIEARISADVKYQVLYRVKADLILSATAPV